jgi:hypothetical protein
MKVASFLPNTSTMKFDSPHIGYPFSYSTVQSLSWAANRFAASQEIPPHFTETRRFITALTSARHLSLSCASPIQSIYPHPTSWRSVLISTHLRPGSIFVLQITNISHTYLFYHVCNTDRQNSDNINISFQKSPKVPIFCNRDSRLRVPGWETSSFSKRPDRPYVPPNLLLTSPLSGNLRR